MFYCLICGCLEVKSSLSRAGGSEEKVYEKVTVANLAFHINIDRQILHLNKVLAHGGGNLYETIFKISHAEGVAQGVGNLTLRIDHADTENSQGVEYSSCVTLWDCFPGFAHSGSSHTRSITLFRYCFTGFLCILGAGTKFILCRRSSMGSSKCFSK